jgi:hypothetical protein
MRAFRIALRGDEKRELDGQAVWKERPLEPAYVAEPKALCFQGERTLAQRGSVVNALPRLCGEQMI